MVYSRFFPFNQNLFSDLLSLPPNVHFLFFIVISTTTARLGTFDFAEKPNLKKRNDRQTDNRIVVTKGKGQGGGGKVVRGGRKDWEGGRGDEDMDYETLL